MSKPTLTPRTLKGFRDYLPTEMAPRRDMIGAIEATFRRHGFAPLDTPALEYAELLTGKYGEEGDKLLYRFRDNGERDVALRYDLTVPLARVVAQHGAALPSPFRRYHVGTVWRADKPQRGRFREFVQCDADLCGHNSAVADAEILSVGLAVLAALGVEDAQIHVNHRFVLTGLIEAAGVPEEAAGVVIRAVDKLDKIGAQGVAAEIVRVAEVSEAVAARVLEVFEAASDLDALDAVLAEAGTSGEKRERSVGRLREVFGLVEAAGFAGKLRFDASIARGLDYYTGIIYETRLTDPRVASIGAVMSGGRYDHLIGMFGKTEVPAVGISLGLDRLLAALRELGLASDGRVGADVFFAMFDPSDEPAAMALASSLRAAGVSVELATERGKLGKQLKAADRRGCRLAVVVAPSEREAGEVMLKNLQSGEQQRVAQSALVDAVRAALA